MLNSLTNRLSNQISNSTHIAPLAVLRIAFGAIMLISTIRFILKGWVTDFYVTPKFFFTFYGFDWIKPLDANGMYVIFFLMAIASLLIMFGLFYRISILSFFICFLYVELIDKTNYLNHYYFVSIMTFLMMLVPAHRYFSLDTIRKPSLKVTHVPAWTINIFKLQLFLVYFFAGLSKLNYDWLFEAMPLKIWLPAKSDLPLIGTLLTEKWIAYFFCWFGAVYDLSIGFLLFNKPTRKIAYLFVVIFHVFTGWFFSIGMFPYIMIMITIIFFSENFHKNLINRLRNIFNRESKIENEIALILKPSLHKFIVSLLAIYFIIQITLPIRFMLYPGNLLWTEEGYRFSWRVMLMEKGGTAFFYVQDPETGNKSEIINSVYLTPLQEKMMVTQPDMILQYAHFLEKEYQKQGIKDPIVTVESYVTLNGSGSRLFIDKNKDLTKVEESFLHKDWILPFKK